MLPRSLGGVVAVRAKGLEWAAKELHRIAEVALDMVNGVGLGLLADGADRVLG